MAQTTEELSDTEIRERFGERIDRALRAFSTDVEYVVAMAEQAALISYKRRLWAVRMEAKAAETEARTRCADDPAVVCANRSACGFGDCRFAKAEHAGLHTEPRDAPAEGSRPVEAMYGYSLEDSIELLMEARGVRQAKARR